MSNTLIETFDGFLTPDLVGRMASVTGESSSSISKAISAAGSLVLGGLVEKADEPAEDEPDHESPHQPEQPPTLSATSTVWLQQVWSRRVRRSRR